MIRVLPRLLFDFAGTRCDVALMTPRERFYCVTEHPPKWPDRVCNEFPGFRSASILDEEPYGLGAVATYVGVPDYADPVPDPSWGYT